MLNADVADLLTGTLGAGGLPGVLADWIEERSEQWGPLTLALRAATPLDDTAKARDSHYTPPRYLVLAEGVVAWLTESQASYSRGELQPAEFARLGFHRTTPGREAAYRLDLPADWPGLPALRGLFGPADARK